jgi:hypothetical protein
MPDPVGGKRLYPGAARDLRPLSAAKQCGSQLGVIGTGRPQHERKRLSRIFRAWERVIFEVPVDLSGDRYLSIVDYRVGGS